jgi:hypothetical protein
MDFGSASVWYRQMMTSEPSMPSNRPSGKKPAIHTEDPANSTASLVLALLISANTSAVFVDMPKNLNLQ